jgi:membrane-associated phospholipid phosphatase
MSAKRSSAHRRRRATRPGYLIAEIGAGLFLLGSAALAGLLLVHRPWPNRLDVKGFALFPADPSSRLYNDIALAGSLRVLVVGVAIAGLVSVWRDRPRAVACTVGPVVAVLVTEWVAKPIVGRHLEVLGGNSYPSGTVTAATALAIALLLAAPPMLRAVLALPAACVVGAVCVAVVAMRWHYPTDALGGICVGAGSVLLLDGFLHLPGTLRASRRGSRDAAVHDLAYFGPPSGQTEAAFTGVAANG